MLKIKIEDIDLDSLGVILNKAGRVVDGINHGRMVLKGDGVYYKIFDKDYCRRENFVKALEAGFFEEVAPALQSLIVDGDDIVGYVTKAGEQLGSEFDRVPEPFYQKIHKWNQYPLQSHSLRFRFQVFCLETHLPYRQSNEYSTDQKV